MKEYRIFEEGEEFYEDINSDDNPFDDYLKIEGKPNLVRDSDTKSIINVDESRYNAYIENYKKVYNQKKREDTMKSELDKMKNDIDEIKQLLRSLVQNK